MEVNVHTVHAGGFVASVLDRLHRHDALTDYGIHVIRSLLANGDMSVRDVVYTNILPTAGGMVANQAHLFAQCLDYYLGEGIEHWPKIQELAASDSPEADEKLMH